MDEDYTPIRLNLGSGTETLIDSFVNLDAKFGNTIYPLEYKPETVDEIRASHVLEHFSHRQVKDVLANWIGCLKPGGLLRIAVPDFKWVAEHYLKGEPIDVQLFAMGDQQDADNFHKSAFDEELLRETMIDLGLERIGFWKSEIKDCATLPVSLNMQGYKPSGPEKYCEKTQAILSCPRFGPMIHMRAAVASFAECRIPYTIMMGAYWHQVLCEAMETAIDRGMEYVISADYDTVFNSHDVLELYRLIRAHEGADAISSMQCKRGGETILLGITEARQRQTVQVYEAKFMMNLMKVARSHFGLTIFRTSSLKKHKRPWMTPIPNEEGRWGERRVDADINFWHRWAEDGLTLYQANKVVVGHMEELISWPGRDLKPVYQNFIDYANNGIPAEVQR